MFCSACGTENAAGSAYCTRCGARLAGASGSAVPPLITAPPSPAYASAMPIERPARYAGFWKRFAALIVDWMFLSLVYFAIGLATGISWDGDGEMWNTDRTSIAVSLGQLIVPWLYWSVMESSAKGATLGKLALGIRVVDLHGQRISFLRATGRFFAKFVSSFILCIGYLMAAFTSRKQALHDLIAGCLVVNRGFEPVDAQGTVPARRGAGLAVGLAIGGVVLLFVIGILAAIAIPAYNDYKVRARVKSLERVGNEATRAINAYYERNQTLPESLDATRFPKDASTDPNVAAIAFDRATRTLTVTPAFSPLEGKALLYVAAPPGDAPRIVWRCTSADIPQRYLPQRCRSAGVTRL